MGLPPLAGQPPGADTDQRQGRNRRKRHLFPRGPVTATLPGTGRRLAGMGDRPERRQTALVYQRGGGPTGVPRGPVGTAPGTGPPGGRQAAGGSGHCHRTGAGSGRGPASEDAGGAGGSGQSAGLAGPGSEPTPRPAPDGPPRRSRQTPPMAGLAGPEPVGRERRRIAHTVAGNASRSRCPTHRVRSASGPGSASRASQRSAQPA